jgi:hypothetical protein
MNRKRHRSAVARNHDLMRAQPEDTDLESLINRHEDAVYGPTLFLIIAVVIGTPLWGWLGSEAVTDFRFQALSLLALVPVPVAVAALVSAFQTRAARHHLVVGPHLAHHADVLTAARRAWDLEPTRAVLEFLALTEEVSGAFAAAAPALLAAEDDARHGEDDTLLAEVHRQGEELRGAAADLLSAVAELEAAQRQRRKLERLSPDLSASASALSDLRSLTKTSLGHARDANRVVEESLLEVQRASSPAKAPGLTSCATRAGVSTTGSMNRKLGTSLKALETNGKRLATKDERTSVLDVVNDHFELMAGATLIIAVLAFIGTGLIGWWDAESFSDFNAWGLLTLTSVGIPLGVAALVNALRNASHRHDVIVGTGSYDAHAALVSVARRAHALEPTSEVLELRDLCAELSGTFMEVSPQLRAAREEARSTGDEELHKEISDNFAELKGAVADLTSAATDLEAAQEERRKLERLRPDLSDTARALSAARARTAGAAQGARDASAVTSAALLEVRQAATKPSGAPLRDLA